MYGIDTYFKQCICSFGDCDLVDAGVVRSAWISSASRCNRHVLKMWGVNHTQWMGEVVH